MEAAVEQALEMLRAGNEHHLDRRTTDRARLKKDVRARLADATALLNRNKPQARQMLKQLIGERNR